MKKEKAIYQNWERLGEMKEKQEMESPESKGDTARSC